MECSLYKHNTDVSCNVSQSKQQTYRNAQEVFSNSRVPCMCLTHLELAGISVISVAIVVRAYRF